jgi:hypothetical protein
LKFFIFIVFFAWISINAQEITLPIVKQGQWFLLKAGKEIPLPRDYTFVNFFDSKGNAYFQKGQVFGVIDEKGKEIISGKYQDIIQYENGYFLAKTDSVYYFFNISNDKFQTIKCKSVALLEENWLLIEEKHKSTIFNINNQLQIEVDTNSNYEIHFNHLVLSKDTSSRILYNQLGEKLIEGKLTLNVTTNYCFVSNPGFKYIFDKFSSWKFAPNASFIDMDDEFIYYKEDKTAYLLNRIDKKILISYPCDKIVPLRNYYMIESAGKVGLISKDKKLLIEVKYDDIVLGESFVSVYFNTLKGLYSYDFKQLIPCKFKTINYDKNFFYTFSLNAYAGLYSRKTNKEILEALYDNIEIQNNVIKAKYRGKLTIIELDSQHKEKSRLSLGETITIRPFASERSKISINYDPRLLDIGWFYDTTNYIKSGLRWGLKTSSDSLIMKAKIKNPIFIPQANFTMIKEKMTDDEYKSLFYTSNFFDRSKYYLLDHTNGKKLKSHLLFHLDSTDYFDKDYCRFKDTSSYGIIDRQNNIRRFTYLELNDHKFIRYCTAKSAELIFKASNTSTQIQNLNIINWNEFPSFFHVEYKEAKWNFLKANGDSLFSQNFDFVQNFYLNTSIVLSKNQWGVVNSDSLVIPTRYASVERMKVYKDSVFLVSVNHKNDIYLDSNLKVIPNFNLTFEKKQGLFTQFSQKDKNLVFNNKTGKLVLETEKSVKIHKFNRLVIKDKKDFEIFDEDGKNIGTVKTKPDEFVNEENFLVENGTKKGLVSIDGDTLIPIEFKEITSFSRYFLCKGNEGTKLYNSDFKLIEENSSGKILVDSQSEYYVMSDEKQTSIYNKKGIRVSKFKTNGVNFSLFVNKHLIAESKKEVYDTLGNLLDLKQKTIDFQVLEDNYFGIQSQEKTWTIYDEKWNKIAEEIPEKRRISYLGDHVFGFKTRNGYIIYDAISHFSSNEYKNAVPNWDEGYLLVEKNNGKFPFEYLNRSFENLFYRSFKAAKLFENGFASVSDERGWTIINKQSYQKSYPNFNQIDALGFNLFKTKEKTSFGIIDSKGKILIAPIYEKLTPLNNNIIQGIKEGKIFYFDYTGKVIYN